jgi:nucleoside-diphosphate-sugar epimerase
MMTAPIVVDKEHVLVTGATGLVGRAAVEHFTNAGYRTTAISRRRPFDAYGAAFLSVDLADRAACEVAFGGIRDCTRIVFAAVEDQPDLVAGWTDQAHVDRNGEMLRNIVDIVTRASPSLRHVTILQGPKAYGAHVKPIRPDSREIRDEVRDIPNFYWPQQDYLAERGREAGWAWTILRPSMVVGEAIGGHANVVAAIGVYAALQKARREPLWFPSSGTMTFEATDTELMARAIEWAGASPNAANRAFNITNGEIFALRDLWPQIAEALGIAPGEDRIQNFKNRMPARAGEWDAIRERHGLRAPAMDAFIRQSWEFLDFVFDRPGPPILTSGVALRQAGFVEAMYTDEMFAKWFARYRADGLLPPV